MLPNPAHGHFTYTRPGRQRTLTNPPSNHCHTRTGTGYAHNGTDKIVAFHHDPACHGTPDGYLKPRQSAHDADFNALKFIR